MTYISDTTGYVIVVKTERKTMGKVLSIKTCGDKDKVISYRRMYVSDFNNAVIKCDSNYEYDYALYLDYLLANKKIKYWFRNSTRLPFSKAISYRNRTQYTYTPDFWIITNKGQLELHEVKGWMNDRSIEILKQLKKDYKDLKTVFIDRKEMIKLQKTYRLIIKDWVAIK